MPFAAAAPIIASGISAVGGALANRKKTATTSSTPTLDPAYSGLQSDLLAKLRARIADPSAGTEPLKTAALTNLNKKYAGASDALNTRLAARGFGPGDGRAGRSQMNLELDRFGEQGALETDFAKMILDRDDSTMGLAERLLSLGRGTTTTSTGTGNAVAGGIDSGVSTLTTLLSLNKLLKGGGGSGGFGGYDWNYDTNSAMG